MVTVKKMTSVSMERKRKEKNKKNMGTVAHERAQKENKSASLYPFCHNEQDHTIVFKMPWYKK